MIFQEALRYFLNTSALSCAQRVYWRRAPEQSTAPYLVFSDMAPEPLHSHSGGSTTIQRAFQFSIFASGQSSAAALAVQLRLLLDGFSGLMGPTSDVRVCSCLWKNQFYNYEPDTKLHMEALDFRFQYYE